MSKVMLLQLPILNYIQKDFVDVEEAYNPSLGLLALGTYLQLNGHEPIIIDMCYERIVVAKLLKIIRVQQPMIVGISMYTENFNHAMTLSKIIKEQFPEIKILLGGAHPTLQPLECMESENIDFVIMKEGESTLVELIEAVSSNEVAIKYEEIKGLVFKRNGKIIKNNYRKNICNLDLLPLLNRTLVKIERYNGIVNIYTSRGCPGKCIYCSATALSGATYRTRSEDSVLLEMVLIKYMLQDRLTKIYIVDDTFTAIPNRISCFTELMKEYDVHIYWQCESRIDVMSNELLKKMHEAGCIAIQYGIESGSQQVLDSIKKGINLDESKKIIECSHQNKIITCLSFMIGHHCDTKETMWQTAYFIEELYNKYRSELALSFNTPFPGTYQYTHRDKLGMRLVTNKYNKYTLLEPIVETDNFNTDDQREIFCYVSKYIGHHERMSKIGG